MSQTFFTHLLNPHNSIRSCIYWVTGNKVLNEWIWQFLNHGPEEKIKDPFPLFMDLILWNESVHKIIPNKASSYFLTEPRIGKISIPQVGINIRKVPILPFNFSFVDLVIRKEQKIKAEHRISIYFGREIVNGTVVCEKQHKELLLNCWACLAPTETITSHKVIMLIILLLIALYTFRGPQLKTSTFLPFLYVIKQKTDKHLRFYFVSYFIERKFFFFFSFLLISQFTTIRITIMVGCGWKKHMTSSFIITSMAFPETKHYRISVKLSLFLDLMVLCMPVWKCWLHHNPGCQHSACKTTEEQQ